jgi:DNA repair exonuclease SbcCD nuclease subunit
MHRIHIANTYLSLAAFNRLDPESGMNPREKQIYDDFLSAIDEIIHQKPGILINAGDLYDVVTPKTQTW